MPINVVLILSKAALNTNALNDNGSCAFADSDPYGIMMAIIGMGIVFTALILFFIIFTNTPVLFTQGFRERLKNLLKFRKDKAEKAELEPKAEEKATEEELSGEVNAAIAAAVYLYRAELHDYEDTVLTIKKVSKTYSPWSSKIYGLRNNLNTN